MTYETKFTDRSLYELALMIREIFEDPETPDEDKCTVAGVIVAMHDGAGVPEGLASEGREAIVTWVRDHGYLERGRDLLAEASA